MIVDINYVDFTDITIAEELDGAPIDDPAVQKLIDPTVAKNILSERARDEQNEESK